MQFVWFFYGHGPPTPYYSGCTGPKNSEAGCTAYFRCPLPQRFPYLLHSLLLHSPSYHFHFPTKVEIKHWPSQHRKHLSPSLPHHPLYVCTVKNYSYAFHSAALSPPGWSRHIQGRRGLVSRAFQTKLDVNEKEMK